MQDFFGMSLEQIMTIMLNSNSHFLTASFRDKDGKTILSFAIALENRAPAQASKAGAHETDSQIVMEVTNGTV